MNSQKYINILESKLLPFYDNFNNNIIFQHDNDPKHASNIVQKYIKNAEINTVEWPSQSPDLNPIENLWAELNRRCKDRKLANE